MRLPHLARSRATPSAQEAAPPPAPPGSPVAGRTDGREDVLLVEPEEALLVWAYLVHVDVVVPCLAAPKNRLDMPVRVGPAGDDFRDRVLGDDGHGLLVVLGMGELVAELSGERDVRADPVGGSTRLGFV